VLPRPDSGSIAGMRIAACLAAMLIFLQPTGCDQSPKPAAKERHYPPIHRFETVSSNGVSGVALDTVTGQWCKTWDWFYKSDALSGGLDTLPTCLSLYNQTQSAPAAE